MNSKASLVQSHNLAGHVGSDVNVAERSGSDLAPKAKLSSNSKLHGPMVLVLLLQGDLPDHIRQSLLGPLSSPPPPSAF